MQTILLAFPISRRGNLVHTLIFWLSKVEFKIVVLLIVAIILILLFPPAHEFTAMAGRDLLYFWWLILLVALAVWLIWGLGKKKK